jgi:hypothetical protein
VSQDAPKEETPEKEKAVEEAPKEETPKEKAAEETPREKAPEKEVKAEPEPEDTKMEEAPVEGESLCSCKFFMFRGCKLSRFAFVKLLTTS